MRESPITAPVVQVCAGATRLVLLCGPWAFKVPRPRPWRSFLNGLLANHQESTFSRLADPRLCPVSWACPGGWLLVMRRAQPFPLQRCLPEWPDLPVESKHDSFGLLAGQPVAVDYGS